MDHLIRLILTLPLEKVSAFLQLLDALTDVSQKDILQSLLITAVQEKNLPEEEAKALLSDPLMVEMERLNGEVLTTWRAETRNAYSEDSRLDVTIKLLQPHVQGEEKATALLLGKIDQLIQLYARHKYGYAENVMTSLYSATFVAAEEAKKIALEHKAAEQAAPVVTTTAVVATVAPDPAPAPKRVVDEALVNALVEQLLQDELDRLVGDLARIQEAHSTSVVPPAKEEKVSDEVITARVVAELQRKFQTQTEEMYRQKLRVAYAKYDVCASLYEGNGKAKIALLCKLDYELKLYRRALESYIETEMREHKADLPAGYFSGAAEESKAPNPYLAMIVDLGQADNPIQQFFARNAGSKKIIGLYEIVLLFQGCLYDKGKNATQRLGMFKKTFIDQHKKLTAIGSESVDHTTTIFLGNIVTILNSNRALFTPPAVSSQWRIGMFAQSMAYYIPRRRSAPAVASTAVPSPQVTAKL